MCFVEVHVRLAITALESTHVEANPWADMIPDVPLPSFLPDVVPPPPIFVSDEPASDVEERKDWGK